MLPQVSSSLRRCATAWLARAHHTDDSYDSICWYEQFLSPDGNLRGAKFLCFASDWHILLGKAMY